MSEDKQSDSFESKWVMGDIGNGVGPEVSGEYDPAEPRPTPQDIDDKVQSLNQWRETHSDQASYTGWWTMWEAYAAGTDRPGPSEGYDGWTQEDFSSVFSKLLSPEEV